MRTTLIAALASLLAIPGSAISNPDPVQAEVAFWEATTTPCRDAVAATFAPRPDAAYLDRYIERQGLSRTDANVQRVLCTAYALGAFDMAEGRIVPLDPE